VTEAQTSCRLYLVLEAGDGAPARLAAGLDAADVATVLVTPARGQRLEAAAASPLVEIAHHCGIATLVAGEAALARAAGADGVHLGWIKEPLAAYRQARAELGADRIVGADAGVSRHDAMTLAESGADYVAFGAPAHLKDRAKARARRDALVAWWAEIFQVPCVAFDAEDAAEAEALARAGADFVAVALASGLDTGQAERMVRDAAARVRAVETAQ
jgi:thiamine-phosphate pyrophosphorylase